MDFTNRGAPQSQARTQPTNSTTAPAGNNNVGGLKSIKKKIVGSGGGDQPGWLRVVTVVWLFSLTVLAISIAVLFYLGNPSEAKYLNAKRVQAVFLSSGQVYFGTIKEISPRFMTLENIYYLNSQEPQPDQAKTATDKQTNFSLIKLGCELHGPYDQMVINRDQVTFWENLRADGQVTNAITQWVKQNPNGQQCKTNDQTSANTPAATTPAANATTDKKQ
jgi:hypothetical protein